MDNKTLDITGCVFGRWTVIARAPTRIALCGVRSRYWHCRCSCGVEKEVSGGSLRSGDSQSCGCRKIEILRQGGNKKHPLYATWCGMKSRCLSPNNPSYSRYGARGVFVCDEWVSSFLAFVHDMGPRPTPKHTVERKDNDGPYAPWNCIWGTKSEQANNRSHGAMITYRGVTKTTAQWASEIGVSYHTLYKRVFVRGQTPEEAFNVSYGKRLTNNKKENS